MVSCGVGFCFSDLFNFASHLLRQQPQAGIIPAPPLLRAPGSGRLRLGLASSGRRGLPLERGRSCHGGHRLELLSMSTYDSGDKRCCVDQRGVVEGGNLRGSEIWRT